jgi:four helix bundle protein
MGDFTELRVWQKAKDLAVYVYQVTDKGRFVKDFGLRDQIRRAAVSIPSNIAEGEESCTNKQSIRYLYISKGSVAETLSQSIIALEIGYLQQEEFEKIKQECNSISKMLSRLIQSKSNTLEEPLPDYPEI